MLNKLNMHKKILKGFYVLMMLTALVLVYTSAITQKNSTQKDKRSVDADKEATNDSLNIGVSTDDDPWKELNNIVRNYYLTGGITYEGSIRLIDGNEEKDKILEEQKFRYTLFNGDYHYSLGEMELISKEKYVVAIDHSNKIIAVSPKRSGNAKTEVFDISVFKKIVEARKGEAKVTQLGSEKILTIDNIEDPTIQGYRIYYSPGTYRVDKMLIGMARLSPLTDDTEGSSIQEEPMAKPEPEQEHFEQTESTATDSIKGYYYYLEVVYSNIKTLALKKKDFNPEDQFIELSKNKVEVKKAYEDYQLLNTVEP